MNLIFRALNKANGTDPILKLEYFSILIEVLFCLLIRLFF